MFEAWGRALYARRRMTLIIAVIFMAFAGIWGTGVFSKLTGGNTFTPPGSQSQNEQNLAAQTFGRNDADVVVLYRSATMTVSDPAYQQAVARSLSGLAANDIEHVTTYWSTRAPNLVSTDRHATYAVLQLTGKDDAARQDAYKAIKTDLATNLAAAGSANLTAQVGGNVPTEVAISSE